MPGFGSALSGTVKTGAKGTGKMVFVVIAVVSAVGTLLGAICKATWFKVQYGHVVVMFRNEKPKLNKTTGKPIIKEAGWRVQVPIRDDKKIVDCRLQTSELKPQEVKAGDGKNGVTGSIQWHPLSLRDGERFRHYPLRTLLVENLNQFVEELTRNAIRQVMANSTTPASEWNSSELYREVTLVVRKPLRKVGVKLDNIMLACAAQSEAQTHGDLVVKALTGAQATPLPHEESTAPDLHSVPN